MASGCPSPIDSPRLKSAEPSIPPPVSSSILPWDLNSIHPVRLAGGSGLLPDVFSHCPTVGLSHTPRSMPADFLDLFGRGPMAHLSDFSPSGSDLSLQELCGLPQSVNPVACLVTGPKMGGSSGRLQFIDYARLPRFL